MKKYNPALLLLFLTPALLKSQFLSLDEAIHLSQTNSVAAQLSKKIRMNKEYEYQVFVASQKPQLHFQAVLPQYGKDYFEVRQPDGGLLFLPREQNALQASMSLSQVIPRSGGQLSLSTRLTRFDDYAREASSYNSAPLSLSYQQPIGGFNPYKWERVLWPLAREEAEKEYKSRMEEIAGQTAGLFFDLAEAQQQVWITAARLEHNQQLLALESQRIQIGATSREMMLRIELQVLRAVQSEQEARSVLRQASLNLFTQLGTEPDTTLPLVLPDYRQVPEINQEHAVVQAGENRPEFSSARLQETEEARDIEKARRSNTPVQLLASLGFNGASASPNQVFRQLRDQQGLSIGVGFPVVDWGRRKAETAIATARQKVGEYTRIQEKMQIRNAIYNQVQSIDLYRAQADLSRQYSNMATERHALAMEQYRRGTLSLTELSIALQEKEEAQRMETHAIRQLWEAYFHLRKMTLYDYVANHKL
ncbi:MAG: TolC family protein [Haliscomenobacter sp.]